MRRVLVVAAILTLAACSGAQPVETPTSSPTLTATVTSTTPAPSVPPTEAPAPASDFYDAGNSADAALVQLAAAGNDADAALVNPIASQPSAVWVGEWLGTAGAEGTVRTITTDAAAAGQIPVFVLYAIPGRDCGYYSAGGLTDSTYLDFVRAVANGIEGPAWFVVEPDALAQLGDCEGQGDRVGLLGAAAQILDDAGADVFLDAGHSAWLSVDEAVRRLELVGTAHLTGFSTNVSNTNSTANERAWADQVAAGTGLVYLTDTSRNGNGSNGEWCNPRGRALGEPPALQAGGSLVATVWVKIPGESDGTCNGGPPSGSWWLEIALELARNA